ncbi:MAG: hypothetical protein P8018_11860 [Acidobacteriota bacterium]
MNRGNHRVLMALTFLAAMSMGLTFFAAGKMGGMNMKMAEKGKTVSVKGEVLDMACYLTKGAHGKRHQQCALTCLRNGEPMGLLGSDGTVYLLLADHKDAKPFNEAKTYAADQVQIMGTMVESHGIKAITVESVKKV